MGELNESRVARVCYFIVFVDTDLSLDCIDRRRRRKMTKPKQTTTSSHNEIKDLEKNKQECF